MTDKRRGARGRQVLFLSAVFSSYLLLPHPTRAQGWDQTAPPKLFCVVCNVGIGTSTPADVFHVFKNSKNILIGTGVGNAGVTEAAIYSTDGVLLVGPSSPGNASANKAFARIVDWGTGGLIIQAFSSVAGLPPVAAKLNLGSGATTGQLTIDTTGRVGIGTTTPDALVHVKGADFRHLGFSNAAGNQSFWQSIDGGAAYFDINRRTVDGVFSNTGKTHSRISMTSGNGVGNISFATSNTNGVQGTEKMRIDGLGNVGIGTTSPGYRLHVYQASTPTEATIHGNYNGDTGLRLKDSFGEWKIGINITQDNAGGFNIYDLSPTTPGHRFAIAATTGYVGIGTTAPTSKLHVVGNATVTGTLTGGAFAATYQDLAEWVPAGGRILPGTVVVIDPDRPGGVRAGSLAYDTGVAGVVSARPGIILGEAGEGKVMVATTGRLKVKVDASRVAVRVGDLLVTSEREGMAMRSEPIVVAGTKIHRPGTLIGKALEPLHAGEGEILVLLSLQ